MLRRISASALLATFLTGGLLAAPVAPELSSRPGAAYTIYLNFTGFGYTGTWGNTGKTPGNVPAYTTDPDATSFSAGEIGNIRQIWARTAQKYAGFDVDITTVDPAVRAGKAGNDAERQAYYDATPRTMHTVIGGTDAWYGSAGGVSYLGTTQNGGYTGGYHTNWVFPNGSAGNLQFLAEATAHENGHGLKLDHQRDQINGGEYSSNGGARGAGSYAPVMGNSYSAQRGAWREGNATGNAQNDVVTLLSNRNIGGLLDDGIGHSLASATPLPLTATGGVTTVDFTRAAGTILPTNGGANGAMGSDNYTRDFFAFDSLGGSITLSARNGTQFLTPGVADPGATLDSTLDVFDATGALVGSGVRDASTLFSTFSRDLTVGRYYARVGSVGGYTSSYEPNAHYFTMGSYFLTGSGKLAAVPEPASLAALGLGALALLRRRRARVS